MKEDSDSWLHHLFELRNASTHVSGIPLAFYAGGVEGGKTALRRPTTLQEFPEDATVTLTKWVIDMRSLTNELRGLAAVEAAG